MGINSEHQALAIFHDIYEKDYHQRELTISPQSPTSHPDLQPAIASTMRSKRNLNKKDGYRRISGFMFPYSYHYLLGGRFL
jgi:hypothetical protein